MLPLKEVSVREKVIVFDDVTKRILVVPTVCHVWETKFTVYSGGTFSISTGKRYGHDHVYVRRGTPDEISSAEDELVDREIARQKVEEEKRRAEYDALPEGIKLARELQFFCANENEKRIAEMPIELLRQIANWIKTTPE